jgi:ATP-dependent RNA helicase RhlE
LHESAGGVSPAPATTFSGIGLHETLLAALREEGYSTPTPIQAQAVPVIMKGRDVLGCAQTGTGKTAAFALPILHRLMEGAGSLALDKSRKGPTPPRVLVLSPTRELATQIGDSFATYGRHTGLTHTVIFGGVSQFHQVRALHKGVDVLVATPGRLIDLMQQRLVNLSAVSVFVLDEADRMLDMGFIKPIQQIAAALPRGSRQTLLFSATMPREIQHLAEALLHDPVRITVTPVSSAAPLIEQRLYHVHKVQKPALLAKLLEDLDAQRAVVFTKTKHGADKVQRRLKAAGITSDAIHGNKAQNYRQRALDAFRDGRIRVLVATDVAARGLDVDDVTHVFNYDLPMEPESYVHRIGRTGRMGKQGLAIAFCDSEERDLLRQIEKISGKKVPVVQLPELPQVDELLTEQAAKSAAWEANRGGRGRREGGGRPSGRGLPSPRDNFRGFQDGPHGDARGLGSPRPGHKNSHTGTHTGLSREHGRTHPHAGTHQGDHGRPGPREGAFLDAVRPERNDGRDDRRGNDRRDWNERGSGKPSGDARGLGSPRPGQPPKMRVAGDDHGDAVMPHRYGPRGGEARSDARAESRSDFRGGQQRGSAPKQYGGPKQGGGEKPGGGVKKQWFGGKKKKGGGGGGGGGRW